MGAAKTKDLRNKENLGQTIKLTEFVYEMQKAGLLERFEHVLELVVGSEGSYNFLKLLIQEKKKEKVVGPPERTKTHGEPLPEEEIINFGLDIDDRFQIEEFLPYFKKALTELIIAKFKTYKAFANAAEVPASAVSRFFNSDKMVPNIKTLQKFGKALGVTEVSFEMPKSLLFKDSEMQEKK